MQGHCDMTLLLLQHHARLLKSATSLKSSGPASSEEQTAMAAACIVLIAVQLLMRLRHLKLMHAQCCQHAQAQLNSSSLGFSGFRPIVHLRLSRSRALYCSSPARHVAL